jgi:hypothetical protein
MIQKRFMIAHVQQQQNFCTGAEDHFFLVLFGTNLHLNKIVANLLS